MVVWRTRDHDDLGKGDSVGEVMIEEEAIDDAAAEVLNASLIDLDGGKGTLRVRLIQASI